MMDEGHVVDARGALGEPAQHRRTERLLILRPQEAADAEAAGSELEDLPGVIAVTFNTLTRSIELVFDPAVVSDDELAAALHHEAYDLVGWQEVRVMHPALQRTWLLEQISSLARHSEHEHVIRGPYADGIVKGGGRRLRSRREGVRSRNGRRDRPVDPGSLPRGTRPTDARNAIALKDVG